MLGEGVFELAPPLLREVEEEGGVRYHPRLRSAGPVRGDQFGEVEPRRLARFRAGEGNLAAVAAGLPSDRAGAHAPTRGQHPSVKLIRQRGRIELDAHGDFEEPEPREGLRRGGGQRFRAGDLPLVLGRQAVE